MLAMVTPREVRLGKAWAREQGRDVRINLKGIDLQIIGMAYKATQLAALMGWDKSDA